MIASWGQGVPWRSRVCHLAAGSHAAAATRWPAASAHSTLPRGCLRRTRSLRVAAARGDVAFAGNDVDAARRLAESVLTRAMQAGCLLSDALELGRKSLINDAARKRSACRSSSDLAAARRTIEMFDHAGTAGVLL